MNLLLSVIIRTLTVVNIICETFPSYPLDSSLFPSNVITTLTLTIIISLPFENMPSFIFLHISNKCVVWF